MNSEKRRAMLSGVNRLNHVLPNKNWEDYLHSFITVIQSDLNPVKKTVRAQKIMRYIHDSEVLVLNEKIENLEKIVGLLKKLYFYGDEDEWSNYEGIQYRVITKTDCDNGAYGHGGKLAREIESAVKKIEEEM